MNYAERARADLLIQLPSLADTPNLLDLYALLVLVKGTETTLEDVHDAWAIRRSVMRPDHPALVPFDELSADVQELDRKYMDAIHAAARALSA